MEQDLDSIDFSPPKAVQQAAQKGLELKDEFGGEGLQEHTIEWARHLADGKPSDPAQARRMRAWFHRHKVDRRANWDDPPTPGYVAWLLWGGDAAEGWAQDLVDQVEAKGGSDAPMASAKHPPQQRKAKAKVKAKNKKKTGTRGAAKKAPGRKTTSKKKASKKTAGKKTPGKRAASKKAAGKKKVGKKKVGKKKVGKASTSRAKAGKKKVARKTATGRRAAGRTAKAGKASGRKAAGRSKKAGARKAATKGAAGGRAKKTGTRRAPGRKPTRR